MAQVRCRDESASECGRHARFSKHVGGALAFLAFIRSSCSPQRLGLFISLLLSVAQLAGAEADVRTEASAQPYFIIHAVDDETGRGVPLVEFETVNHVRHFTDSAGVIAFNEPGLMDREVYFHVQSHGYLYPQDFLGYHGLKLTPRAGAHATVRLKRENVAERLYRVTGAGIYRDSVLAGLPLPIRQPLLNAEVMGQDTVIVTPYRGKLYWFWGDTDQVSYPLGNFGASGATSELPGRGGLDPNVGVNLTYFVQPSGFVKTMCPEFGRGLHWIESVMVLPDRSGVERLVARVSSQEGLVTPYAWHFAVFNDEKEIFESKLQWQSSDSHDAAHPFRARANGIDYLYLYPNYRVKADLDSVADAKAYEAFTCVAGDGKLRSENIVVDRQPNGAPRYTWKRGADRLDRGRAKQLTAAGLVQTSESWLQLYDVTTGSALTGVRGSVFWNEFRARWIMLVTSAPGEVWWSEADNPTGPWCYARRVVSHHDYNFYNPTQHPYFDQDGGRVIFFEGTYTESFSAARTKTPRYDYNQIMYQLSLDDARLNLPAAVYHVAADSEARLMQREGVESSGAWGHIESVAFYAIPARLKSSGLIPIFETANHRLTAEMRGDAKPLFLALPPQPTSTNHAFAGRWSWRFTDEDGNNLDVEFDHLEEAGAVQIVGADKKTRGQGKLDAGQLKLSVTHEEDHFALTGTMRDGTLHGSWRRSNEKDSGTWSATWQDMTPPEHRSAAIVPLYEYHRSSDDRYFHSTDPALVREGFVRRETPLCRVWRAPSSAITFDTTVVSAIK